MDGREGMSLPGSASFYFSRGGIGSSGPGPNVHGGGGMHSPPVFKTISNPNISMQQPSVGPTGGAGNGAPFHVENPSPNFPHGTSMAIVPSMSSGGETVKKKRGRPRKYGPDGAKTSLKLSPMSAPTPSSEALSSGEKVRRGRPPGSGWKQKLAPLGEWMNSSAGLAFTPHVLHVGVGEDVAAKILAFAQQRSRALCILSANGSVSALTLRQPTTSGGSVTYEGRFEILCLSGSYLVDENGGPRDRTGGISISVCSPDGHIIGGAIGGKLIAANPVQVVACSFVYGGTSTKGKNKAESVIKDEKYMLEQSGEKSIIPVSGGAPSQNLTPNTGTSVWPPEAKISQTDIDLSR
ncbi:hypothetical protein BUALT_Bualt10G0047000 [Buddleja alternifolia]|uniref:AT-hook motif nuclear-localized protein n=1 Tax=Buddleja alternifolia TaxID=168488 RepID=A0AAV6X3B9_9LAMI|nr:hypothetical protein BUALT_Bualt10G0047000 [Buddleja alternifolia]